MAASGDYAAKTSVLRETAKWIAAAFVGSGAVLFSGLSFTNTTRTAVTEGWEVPIAIAAVPLAAAGWAVWSAARVVTTQARPVDRLLPLFAQARLGTSGAPLSVKEQAAIERMLPDITTKYGGIAELDARLRTAYTAMRAAQDAVDKDGSTTLRAKLADATQRFEALQSGVSELVQVSEYAIVRRRHRQALWQMVPAALLAVAAVAASGVLAARIERTATAAQGDATQPASVQRPVAVVLVFNSGAPALEAGPLHCSVRNGSRAVAVGGTFARPILVMNPPAPSPSASPSPGAPSPASALPPAGPPQCAGSWIWQPGPDQVTAVPVDTVPGG